MAVISKVFKGLYQNGPRFWNYHNSEPFQMTPRLMVLEFWSVCYIGALMFVRTVYCLLALNTFYGTSVAINYVLKKFWYRGVQTSLARRQTIIEGSFAGRMRKSHSKWNQVSWTSVAINYVLENSETGASKLLLQCDKPSLRVRLQDACVKRTVSVTTFYELLLPLITFWRNSDRGASELLWQSDKQSLWVHLQDASVKLTVNETTFYELLLPLTTFWKKPIQGRPNFFSKATNHHWRVLLQDACVKLTVSVIRTHLKYCTTFTV